MCLPNSREWLEGLWDKEFPSGRPTKQAVDSGMPSSIQHLAAWSIRSSAPPHCLFRRVWPCWELYPGRSLPVPWDRKELGPWEKQAAQSPLNFDYRNKTWRRMLEEGPQLPGLGERVTSSLFPQTLQAWFRKRDRSSCQGVSFPAQHSALSSPQLWREGSAPASLLNYSVYTHPITFMGSI